MNKNKKSKIILITISIIVFVFVMFLLIIKIKKKDDVTANTTTIKNIDEIIKIEKLEVAILNININENNSEVLLKIKNKDNEKRLFKNLKLTFINREDNVITEVLATIDSYIESNEEIVFNVYSDINLSGATSVKYELLD